MLCVFRYIFNLIKTKSIFSVSLIKIYLYSVKYKYYVLYLVGNFWKILCTVNFQITMLAANFVYYKQLYILQTVIYILNVKMIRIEFWNGQLDKKGNLVKTKHNPCLWTNVDEINKPCVLLIKKH